MFINVHNFKCLDVTINGANNNRKEIKIRTTAVKKFYCEGLMNILKSKQVSLAWNYDIHSTLRTRCNTVFLYVLLFSSINNYSYPDRS